MKRTISIMVAISLLLCLSIGSYAYAFGVTKNSRTSPSSVTVGNTAKYALSLKYDTEVYGIPVPQVGQIGIELPSKIFNKPTYSSGSFSTMGFITRTGSMTGVASYQCYKSFGLAGTISKSYTVKAKVKSNVAGKNGKAYMGVGPSAYGYDYFFTVTAKK